jgi:tRNA dimethylallyltransferase
LKPRLIVILGPTAVGKTELSVELAAALDGEIISGDSMQFYRYMDIGTAKIRPDEMTAAGGMTIPHHLIDIINPDEPYSVADFQRDASQLVAEINARGRIPILAGGTGLYVSALIHGYTFSKDEGEDPEFRSRKQAELAEKGGEVLLAELAAVDPQAAARMNPADGKRIIRALEVYHLTGKTITEQSRKNPPDWDITLIGLQREREQLYDRINKRVLKMLDAGFEAEVRGLLAMGYGRNLKPMQGLGYKQLCMYLAGEITLNEAVYLIQRDTRHFAKRQLTWWRRESGVNWFDLTDTQSAGEILPQILKIC